MTDTRLLQVDIRSYWHAGTGRGSGNHLDALVERDADGLPFVSGKMLKGLLRDAVNRATTWDVLPVLQDKTTVPQPIDVVELLFGSPGFGRDNVPSDETKPGVLKISDARMPAVLCDWLRGDTPEHRRWRGQLQRSVYSTAIDSDSGVAKGGSLRGQEVTVPMQLESRIRLLPLVHQLPDDLTREFVTAHWSEIVQQALPLVRAVGSNRTRGLGRACLSLKQVEVVA